MGKRKRQSRASEELVPLELVITDLELSAAVGMLAEAAHSYRRPLLDALLAFRLKVIIDRAEILDVSDKIISGWRRQLGHDVEE